MPLRGRTQHHHRAEGVGCPLKPPSFHRVRGWWYPKKTTIVSLSSLRAGFAASAATAEWVSPEEHRNSGDDLRKIVSACSAILGSTVGTCSCVFLRKFLEKRKSHMLFVKVDSDFAVDSSPALRSCDFTARAGSSTLQTTPEIHHLLIWTHGRRANNNRSIWVGIPIT